jgi:hypothetical protein
MRFCYSAKGFLQFTLLAFGQTPTVTAVDTLASCGIFLTQALYFSRNSANLSRFPPTLTQAFIFLWISFYLEFISVLSARNPSATNLASAALCISEEEIYVFVKLPGNSQTASRSWH